MNPNRWFKRAPALFFPLVILASGVAGPNATLASGWIDRAPIPRPRMFHIAGVGGDGRIYVAAGKVQKPGSGVVYPGIGDLALDIYTPRTNSWEQGPEIWKYEALSRHTDTVYSTEDPKKIIYEAVKESRIPMELQSEYPPGVAASDGRFYWFTNLGPVYFDPEKKAWAQGEPVFFDVEDDRLIPPLSKWAHSMGATVASSDGKLYLVAGVGHPSLTGSRIKDPYRLLPTIEIYDPKTRGWQETAPMREVRQMPAAAFGRDGKLYVFGGYGDMGFSRREEGESVAEYEARSRREDKLARNALRSVEAYDPATDTWEDRAPMPAGRQSMGAALGADGRIYVVGGADQYTSPAPKAEVFIYDPKTNTWSEGPPLNHPRYHHAVVATPDGRIWAIGGTNGTNRWGALPRGEPEGLVRPIEMLDTRPASARPAAAPLD